MPRRITPWRAFGLAIFLSGPAVYGEAPADKVRVCESCHGPGGNSVMPGTPSLAGQPATFLENQLVYLREGLRDSPAMAPLARAMKDEEMVALARHFAAQKATKASSASTDDTLATRGAQLAQKMHCGQCHLPRFQGRDQMPRLAGQREEYLVEAMTGYRDGKRTRADTTMSEALYGASDADIKALAHYLARLD